MKTEKIKPSAKFNGSPAIPGDKSISHRGLIFGALAESGTTVIENLLDSGDVNSTASCLKQMGVKIKKENGLTYVEGLGPRNFIIPKEVLDCGNSGTTMRLLMGLLSSIHGMKATLTGDDSLTKRPMRRVAEPLSFMGSVINMKNDNFAPLEVSGDYLRGIDYELKIASAQIKTAIILAAIFANGKTRITGEIHSRDHTERLLSHFGVHIKSTSTEVLIEGGQKFKANKLKVPSDPSTAAFWLAGASLIKGSDLHLKNVSLNPTRIGFIRALEKMGGKVQTTVTETDPEPIGDIRCTYSELKGITLSEAEIPSLIDELPILSVLASQAKGRTVVTGAEELRVKETDRIEALATNLRLMGVQIETTPDGFIIEGPQKLKGATMDSFHDHRIAMAFSIAGLVAEGETNIENADCVSISYPAFFTTLKDLTK
jgi:3-phosphoshikimate 1-carboxyvinyltransferase